MRAGPQEKPLHEATHHHVCEIVTEILEVHPEGKEKPLKWQPDRSGNSRKSRTRTLRHLGQRDPSSLCLHGSSSATPVTCGGQRSKRLQSDTEVFAQVRQMCLPLTPGTSPVRRPPRVPHAHHKEPGRPLLLHQPVPQPHLLHRRDPVGVSSHKTAVQHRLHHLALCWLRRGNIFKVWLSLLGSGTEKNRTRMEQVMSALRSCASANVWKSVRLSSLRRRRASWSRLRGSETPPVKSIRASVVFPPSSAS